MVRISHHVGLAESQIGVAGLQLFDVRLRAVAHQTHNIDTGIVGSMLCNHAAERIISAGLTAGDKTQLGRTAVAVAAATGDQAQGHDQSQNQCKKLFHKYSPLFF